MFNTKSNAMKHYLIEIVDGYTAKTIKLNFYGQLSNILYNGKEYKSIVNEFNIPIFIAGLNTTSIKEFDINSSQSSELTEADYWDGDESDKIQY